MTIKDYLFYQKEVLWTPKHHLQNFSPKIIFIFTSCHKLNCNWVESVLWEAYSLFVLLSLKYVILTTVHCGWSGIFKVDVVLESRESSLNFLKTYTLVIETWKPKEPLFFFFFFAFWKHDSVWKNHTEVIFCANGTRYSLSADLLICCTFRNTMFGCCFILIEYLPNSSGRGTYPLLFFFIADMEPHWHVDDNDSNNLLWENTSQHSWLTVNVVFFRTMNALSPVFVYAHLSWMSCSQ